MASMQSTFGWKVLRDILADATAEYGRTALVTGPVAAGKTTLLDEFAAYAATRDVRVLRADCSPFGDTGPLAVSRQLLGERAPDTDRDITATVAEILRMAQDTTVLVRVDDLRYADPASARLITRLSSDIADRRVLVVAADRTNSPYGSHWLADELAGRSTFRKISLTSLTAEQVRDLAADFGVRLTPDAASRTLRLSNGNLLITTALLRDFAGGRTVVGAAYAQAVLECLHRLDPEVREIAEAIAVAGDSRSPRLIAELATTETTAVEEAARDLVAAGLLADGGFRHPVARAAVLGYIPRKRRAHLGRQTAVALNADGVSAEDAAQWLESFENGFVSAHLPERHSGEEFRVSGHRPETLWEARDIVGTIDRGIHDLTSRENRRVTDLEAGKLLVAAEFPGLLRQAVGNRAPRTRIDTTSVPDARYAAAWSLAGTLTGRTDPRQTTGLAEQALERGIFTDETAPAVLAALWAQIHSGAPEQARAWCDRFLTDAQGDDITPWRAQLTALRAESALALGDHTAAVTDAGQALRQLPARRWGVRIGGPLATLVLAHTLLGTPDETAVLLRRRVPASMYETRYGLGYLYARGHHHLAQGDHLPALADFLRCGRVLADWDLDRGWRMPWQLSAAATYMAMGDYSQSVEYIVQSLDRPWQTTFDDGPGETRFDLREAIFEHLREATGTPTLPTVVAGLRSGDLIQNRDHADVPRYKIYDRNAVCLQQLSPSERRVAVLAAQGISNQKIARELSVTVSTVEQHLTRTYRKLQLADRQELRSRLG